jgi:hypothetical protein
MILEAASYNSVFSPKESALLRGSAGWKELRSKRVWAREGAGGRDGLTPEDFQLLALKVPLLLWVVCN